VRALALCGDMSTKGGRTGVSGRPPSRVGVIEPPRTSTNGAASERTGPGRLLVLAVRVREAELPRVVLAAHARRVRPAGTLALRHAVRIAPKA
jgi:hypothetical protein